MKVLIIEDEIPSRLNLQRALLSIAGDLEIVGMLGSVSEAVEWFDTHPEGADLIFMDVQLSDGLGFDIFKATAVKGQVVITTAYDNYALDAFKIHSVDYLLKPIEQGALRAAVDHCRSLTQPAIEPINYTKLAELFSQPQKPRYKDRFLVKVGDKIIPISADNITLFYADNKTTYLTTSEGRDYIIDDSLDTIEGKIDGSKFFRIGRSQIVALNAIQVVSKHFGSRLKVQLKSSGRDDLFVSRARSNDFLEWLNGGE